MAKPDTKESLIPSVFIGNNTEPSLLHSLKESINTAKQIDIIVSFLMESGVKQLIEDLKKAVEQDIPIRILTGNYLNITQPSALALLKRELGDHLDLRLYKDENRSFHPKAYMFHQNDHKEIYLGSSNLSLSGLSSGVEWNYRFTDDKDPESFNHFYNEFERLFNEESIILGLEEINEYAQNWHRPSVYKDINRIEKQNSLFQPRGMQTEALLALEKAREEGATKALIHAATGVGKTYLAAFDSSNYPKILFIAHRKEILEQAEKSFKNVYPEKTTGFYNQDNKALDSDILFASVFTLGKKEHLKNFEPDQFDYIIIDEFHHAAANMYQSILEYFEPKFLLGLTATPERTDQQSIYKLCDYNVPYSVTLKDAINQDLLVPFHYYGIYDPEIDYSTITYNNGQYSKSELDNNYIFNINRDFLILDHYNSHSSKRALGFCSSKLHADHMAKVFNEYGIPSVAVYSGTPLSENYSSREEAIEKLKNNEIRVIFSVDMFNEGIDIPEIDTVLFLRPTESSIIFLQQLGRGLRKSSGKDHLTVLDFIGNYRNAGIVRFLLSGNNPQSYLINKDNTFGDSVVYPDDCYVHFDLELIDLFEKMSQKERLSLQAKKNLITQEYRKIKEELKGRRPTRVEFYNLSNKRIKDLCFDNSILNPFRNYLGFLNDIGELSTEETKVYQSVAGLFLNTLETTSMTRSYKVPTILSIYNNGELNFKVTKEELLRTWIEYYSDDEHWRDLSTKKEFNYEAFTEISDQKHLQNIIKNPVNYLSKSSSEFFYYDKADKTFNLDKSLLRFKNNRFFIEQIKDILNFRSIRYFDRKF